jgi:hypothetical protein
MVQVMAGQLGLDCVRHIGDDYHGASVAGVSS